MDLDVGQDGRYVVGKRYGRGEGGGQLGSREAGGLSWSPRRGRSNTQNPRVAGVTVSPKITTDGRSPQNFSRDNYGPEKRSEESDMKATEAKIRHLAEKYSGGNNTPSKLAAPQHTEKVKIHDLLKNNPTGNFPKDSENHIFISTNNHTRPPTYISNLNSDNIESSPNPNTNPHTDQPPIPPTSHHLYHQSHTIGQTAYSHIHPNNPDPPQYPNELQIIDKTDQNPLYHNDKGQKYPETTIRVVSADERIDNMHESLKWDQLPIEE